MYNLRVNKANLPWKRRIFASTALFLIVGVFLLPHYALASSINDENIIKLTNEERLREGLRELTANQLLSKAAYDKAEAIFDTQEFKHNIDDKTFSNWVKDAGYEYQNVGENLAIDFVTSEGTMGAWLDSPSHKKNILNPKFKEIGIAVKQDKFDGQESIVVVQIFGTPITEKTVASTFEQVPEPSATETGNTPSQPPKTLIVTNTGNINPTWLVENLPVGSEILKQISNSMEYYTQIALIILDYTDIILMNYYYSVILLLLFVFTSSYIWHRKEQENEQQLMMEH